MAEDLTLVWKLMEASSERVYKFPNKYSIDRKLKGVQLGREKGEKTRVCEPEEKRWVRTVSAAENLFYMEVLFLIEYGLSVASLHENKSVSIDLARHVRAEKIENVDPPMCTFIKYC